MMDNLEYALNCHHDRGSVYTIAAPPFVKCRRLTMDVETLAAATIYLFSVYNHYINVYSKRAVKTKWRRRRWWMLTIHRNRTRQSMNNQLAELLAEPSGEFDNFVRMSITDFEYLLQKISPLVAKQDTDWRDSIPVKIRLAITLRYLATGDSYRSLHYIFKVSSQSISKIIIEVCLALNMVLKYSVKLPTTDIEWLSKAEKFRFPHCLGVIDGKHISIQAPSNSASDYYNYKRSFSIVILALVDNDYCFMYADIGSKGRISDGGVFNNSKLWEKISSESLNLPQPNLLPGSNIVAPYVFLGDGAFALSTHVMKPFPGYHALGTPERLFNQKLSSSRVVVENAFGILASKFRIFRSPIPMTPVKASIITLTCVLLHNFLRKSITSRTTYNPPGFVDTFINGELVQPGQWRTGLNNGILLPLQSIPRRCTNDALQTRLDFMNYFSNNN